MRHVGKWTWGRVRYWCT